VSAVLIERAQPPHLIGWAHPACLDGQVGWRILLDIDSASKQCSFCQESIGDRARPEAASGGPRILRRVGMENLGVRSVSRREPRS